MTFYVILALCACALVLADHWWLDDDDDDDDDFGCCV